MRLLICGDIVGRAAREAVAIRNTPEFCNAGYMCDYREKAS